MRIKISLACVKCGTRNYFSTKNKKTSTVKLNVNKFCNNCKSLNIHKEKSIK